MKMLAAVLDRMQMSSPYAQSKPVTVETIEIGEPGPGEVLVRITAAGLCHSDLSIINGDRPRPMPMVLGHEAAGVVESCGPGVGDLSRGDSVAQCVLDQRLQDQGGRRCANQARRPTGPARSSAGTAS